jgi:hypothetical protein
VQLFSEEEFHLPLLAKNGYQNLLHGKLIDTPEPAFSPIMINGTRAELVKIRGAGGTFQDNAGGLHFQYFSVFFVHDLIHAFENAESHSTIFEHFRIEEQTAVAIPTIQGGEDLLSGLYLHEFAWLEVQLRQNWGWLLATLNIGVLDTSPQGLELVKCLDQQQTKNINNSEEKFESFFALRVG